PKAKQLGVDILLLSAAQNIDFNLLSTLLIALAPLIDNKEGDSEWTKRVLKAANKQGAECETESTKTLWADWLAHAAKRDLPLIKKILDEFPLDALTTESLIEKLITIDASKALILYSECIKKPLLSPVVECALFEKLLSSCRQTEHISLL